MKILLSVFACDPTKGGESGRSWNWACTNAELGHQVWCLARAENRPQIEAAREQLALPNLHFRYLKLPRWGDRLYQFQPIGLYTYYLIWQYKAYQLAKELDQEVGFDVVHHISWGSFQLGTMLWKLRKPLIFGPVGGGQFPPAQYKKYFRFGWKSEVLRIWTSKILLLLNDSVRQTVKRASLVLTVNKETYHLARQMGARQVELYLDTSLSADALPKSFPERTPSAVLKVLWVGRLFPRKGVNLALEALSRVSPDVPFTLTILGDGPFGSLVPGWLKELDLQDKVKWLGQAPFSQVKEAYLSHDVFLFSSLRDSFGSQILEAMAYGLPVIVLDHQGAGDFVPDDAGIKVPVRDPASTIRAMAEAVEFMYRHPADRVSFGKRGYAFAKNQMWDAKKELIAGYYVKVTEAVPAVTGR
jgi:glycosyltransferase involved in cell wall biosynthesis